MAQLAKVTHAMSEKRGADVTYELKVPQAWLQQGASVTFTLPSRLNCARCDGGGCDTCGRSGVVRPEIPDSDRSITVHLPKTPEPAAALRLPGYGAKATQPDEPRGFLVLTLRAGAPSPGVKLAAQDQKAPLPYKKYAGFVVVFLVIVGLLQLLL